MIFLDVFYMISMAFFIRRVNAFQSNFRSFNFNRLFSTAKSSPYYITTPIFYVNGNPHIGHAYSLVVADTIARFNRMDHKDVFFLSGTDEHGQKVERSAASSKLSPIDYCTIQSNKFRELCYKLGASNDDFIRTTEERHKNTVLEVWKKLQCNGYIYRGVYEGYYAIKDECFYDKSELVDGKAPTGAEVEWVSEDSYFFRLSAFTNTLQAHCASHPQFIIPSTRMNSVVSFLNQPGGLRDLSISRTSFSWGIEIPSSESDTDKDRHVVYVWLDALINYLTPLGYQLDASNNLIDSATRSKYWPADLHVIGKDILTFHAVFWPAFLLALGLDPPRQILAHGWWTQGGEKMSKSVGNVVDPFQYISQYGQDSFRYFLLSEGTVSADNDFTEQHFIKRVNSHLANDLGNLVQRSLSMIAKNCNGVVQVPDFNHLDAHSLALLRLAEDALTQSRLHVGEGNIHKMCECVFNMVRSCNKYFDECAPWTLVSSDPAKLSVVLYVTVEAIRRIAILLTPIVPGACSAIFDQIGVPSDMRSFQSISRHITDPCSIVKTPKPIFPRIPVKK